MGAENCVKQEEMSTYQIQHATYDSAYHGFSNIGEVQKPNSYNSLYITNGLYAPRQHDCSSPSSLTNLNTSASSPPNSMGHAHSPAMLGSSLVPTPPTPNESPPTSTSQDDGLANQGGSHPFISGMDYRHPHVNPPHHHHYAFHHLQGGQFPGPAGNGHGFLSGSLNHPTAYFPTQAALGAAAAAARTRTRDKYRVVYSEHQRMELEKEFLLARYVTIKRKTEMATQLNLSERQIKIWFQNRRAKDRKTGEKLKSNSSHSKVSPAASCAESSPSGDQSVQQHVHALQHQQQLQQQQAHLMQMQAHQHQHHQELAQHHNGGVTDNHLASLSSGEGFQHPEISIAPVPSCDPALRRDPSGSSATSGSVPLLGHSHVEQLSSSLSPESQMPSASLQQHLQHQHLHQQHHQSQQQHVSYPMSHHHYNPYHQPYAPLTRSSSTLLDFPSDFHVHHSMYGMNHFENLRHHHQQHLHQQQQPQLHHNSLQHHPNNSGQQQSQHHSQQQATSLSVSVPMVSAPGSSDSLLMHTDPSAISQNTTHDLQTGASISGVATSPGSGQSDDSKAAAQLKHARHPKVKTEMCE